MGHDRIQQLPCRNLAQHLPIGVGEYCICVPISPEWSNKPQGLLRIQSFSCRTDKTYKMAAFFFQSQLLATNKLQSEKPFSLLSLNAYLLQDIISSKHQRKTQSSQFPHLGQPSIPRGKLYIDTRNCRQKKHKVLESEWSDLLPNLLCFRWDLINPYIIALPYSFPLQ